MNELKSLISRYVEDRESLSDEELLRLEAAIRTDQDAATLLKEQLMLDELLAQRFSIDRGNFPAQMEQRIRDHKEGMPGRIESASDLVGQQQLVDLRSRVYGEIDRWQERETRGRILRWSVTVTTVVLVAFLGFYSAVNWRRSQPIVVVDDVFGSGFVVRDSSSFPVAAGTKLFRGDALSTGDNSLVTLHYADDTVLRLRPETRIEFLTVLHSAKHVRLESGNVSANVAPQADGLPMRFFTPSAEAIVRGTELSLQVRPKSTRLDVASGAVEIKRPGEALPAVVRQHEFGIATADTLTVADSPWPVNREGLALQFETLNQPAIVLNSLTKRWDGLSVVPRGDVEFDEYAAMRPKAGAFIAQNAAEHLLELFRPAAALSLELTVRPDSLHPKGPSRIVTFSHDSHVTNFSLVQEADRILFRLQTGVDEKPSATREFELFRLTDRLPHHVAVTYRDGELLGYLDGRRTFATSDLRGGFRNWQKTPMLFGDEWIGDRKWSGTIERVAIFTRALSAEEVAGNAAVQRQVRRERLVGSGLELRRLEVVARLLAKSKIMNAAEFAPNRDGLAVYKYEVVESVTGTLQPGDEIFVAHWAILNAQEQSVALQQPGDERLLAIDRFDRHPRLEGYVRSDDFLEGNAAKAPRFIQIDGEFPSID